MAFYVSTTIFNPLLLTNKAVNLKFITYENIYVQYESMVNMKEFVTNALQDGH